MKKSNKEQRELIAQLAVYKKWIILYDLQFESNSFSIIW